MSATEDAIDEAITAHARADGYTGAIAGWIVIAPTIDYDADGDEISGLITIYPRGSMPWHSALGIVEAARIRMHHQYADDGS